MVSPLARTRALIVCGLVALFVLSGCAVTSNNPRDPLESLNRGIYHFNDGVDNLLVKPVAIVYKGVVPQIARTGVSNFFSNINDVIVALNNLLQGKFTQAVSDVGRILVNTTAGLLGVIDVATEIGLEKHNEDFGQTLGWWGVGSGPYLVLPFIGPSSFRDGVGWLADFYTDPITYVDPSRDRNILWGTRLVSRRSELLDAEEIVKTAALDPYEFIRDAYLQRRRNLVYDGNPPPDKDEDVDIKVKPKSEGFRWPWSSAPSAARVPAAAPGSDRAPLTPAQAEERERELAQQQKNSVQDNARSEPRAGLTPAQAEEREREITPQPGAQEEPRAEAAPSSGQNGRVARVWLPVAR
jgi:phospholipid-binding lipoprotein MlaA